jgi:hypothetical protein
MLWRFPSMLWKFLSMLWNSSLCFGGSSISMLWNSSLCFGIALCFESSALEVPLYDFGSWSLLATPLTQAEQSHNLSESGGNTLLICQYTYRGMASDRDRCMQYIVLHVYQLHVPTNHFMRITQSELNHCLASKVSGH